MKLILSIINTDNSIAPQDRSRTWIDNGGAIGRFDGNDWVLPDPRSEISRVHAKVHFLNNTFSIEDLSTNGVFITDSDNRIGQGRHALSDGDTLFIGHYQISVCIEKVAPRENNISPTPSGKKQVEPVPTPIDTPFSPNLVKPEKPVVIPNDGFRDIHEHMPVVPSRPSDENNIKKEWPEPPVANTVNLIPENWLDTSINNITSETASNVTTNDNHEVPGSKQLDKANEDKANKVDESDEVDNGEVHEKLSDDLLNRHLSAQKAAAQAMFDALMSELSLKKLHDLSTKEDKNALFKRLYESTFKPRYENTLKELKDCKLKLIL